jgi:hypothetical protein
MWLKNRIRVRHICLLAVFLGLAGCASKIEKLESSEQRIYKVISPTASQQDKSIIFGSKRTDVVYIYYGEDYEYVNIIAVDETKVGEYNDFISQPPNTVFSLSDLDFTQPISNYRVELSPGQHTLLVLVYSSYTNCSYVELEYNIEPNNVYVVKKEKGDNVHIIDTRSNKATRFNDYIKFRDYFVKKSCYSIEMIRNKFIAENKKEKDSQ